MKKYIIKRVDGSEQNVMNAIHKSRKEAVKTLMDYICKHNRYLDTTCANDDDYLSPFDFTLEEVECKEVNEVITDIESARRALGLNSNSDFTVVKRSHYENTIQLKDITKLVNEITPKHLEALVALNELFAIAEAWNKADGFVPDFSDWNQYKWYPWFKYDKDAAGFVYAHTLDTPSTAPAYFVSRLCFKTAKRAEQFGKQFTHLYNKVFC